MKTAFAQHLAALREACRRLAATPLNTALSLLVIGIALTLPTAGWLVLENLRQATGNAAGIQQISLFLSLDAEQRDIGEIERRLRATSIGRWQFVSRAEALKHLQASEGMAEIIASLPNNPLPDAFILTPDDASPAALDKLATDFATWPKVAHVQLDSAWVQRFDALLKLGKRLVLLLAILFATALVTITFTTIRLQILAQAAEIEVAKLVGATEAWIQRPLLHFGILQGALGGLVAALLVVTGFHLLRPAVGELARLYAADFVLQSLSGADIAVLAGIGGMLGWLGARLSALLHLQRLD